jgi:hypothetical protein
MELEDYHNAFLMRHHLIGAGLAELAKKIRPMTLEQAKADYENLKKVKPGTNLTGRIGNRASDYYFFEKRLDTGSKKKGSETFPQFWKRKGYNDAPSYKRLFDAQIKEGDSPEKAAFQVFSLYWSAINSFKAVTARAVYGKFKPKCVLDFSAGWGGRCLAAMSMDIDYIGFDTNTDLKKPYAAMIKDMPHSSKAVVYFKDSAKVDYSKYKYDMVFTSPPYYIKTAPTEKYAHMPHYKDREEFNAKFLYPVLTKTWNNLQVGGHYCLNVPQDMYEDVKVVLGAAPSKMLLPKVSRGGSGKGNYKEYIYFWTKSSSAALTGAANGLRAVRSIRRINPVAEQRMIDEAARRQAEAQQALEVIERLRGRDRRGQTLAESNERRRRQRAADAFAAVASHPSNPEGAYFMAPNAAPRNPTGAYFMAPNALEFGLDGEGLKGGAKIRPAVYNQIVGLLQKKTSTPAQLLALFNALPTDDKDDINELVQLDGFANFNSWWALRTPDKDYRDDLLGLITFCAESDDEE